MIEVNGKKLHYYEKKSDDNKETLVFLKGLGSGDATVSTQPMFEKLVDFNLFVLDRAGYGLSEDTSEERTVQVIVNEYRAKH